MEKYQYLVINHDTGESLDSGNREDFEGWEDSDTALSAGYKSAKDNRFNRRNTKIYSYVNKIMFLILCALALPGFSQDTEVTVYNVFILDGFYIEPTGAETIDEVYLELSTDGLHVNLRAPWNEDLYWLILTYDRENDRYLDTEGIQWYVDFYKLGVTIYNPAEDGPTYDLYLSKPSRVGKPTSL